MRKEQTEQIVISSPKAYYSAFIVDPAGPVRLGERWDPFDYAVGGTVPVNGDLAGQMRARPHHTNLHRAHSVDPVTAFDAHRWRALCSVPLTEPVLRFAAGCEVELKQGCEVIGEAPLLQLLMEGDAALQTTFNNSDDINCRVMVTSPDADAICVTRRVTPLESLQISFDVEAACAAVMKKMPSQFDWHWRSRKRYAAILEAVSATIETVTRKAQLADAYLTRALPPILFWIRISGIETGPLGT